MVYHGPDREMVSILEGKFFMIRLASFRGTAPSSAASNSLIISSINRGNSTEACGETIGAGDIDADMKWKDLHEDGNVLNLLW